MSEASAPPADSYSPRYRTALVLSGTGTAGAYHAGVLRALNEAGVKLDLVAGRGVGVVGALFAAIDGAERLWREKGFWRASHVGTFYRWRATARLAAWALATSVAVVALPIAAAALGLVVFPVDFLLKMAGAGGAGGLVAAYLRIAETAFAAEMLPTWLPRIVVLLLSAVGLTVLVLALTNESGRGRRGAFWWRLVQPPLSSSGMASHVWRAMWELVCGAVQVKQPAARDLGRRYTELLRENLGQPGFRELLLTVHDIDARRDLVFALVAESRRRDLVQRQTTAGARERQAEVFDLSGVGGDHILAAVAGALSIPIATTASTVTFGPETYWRGETHRLCDRPAGTARLLQELPALGVEQAIVVSASPESSGPHALSLAPLDGRARIGEYLQSAEASSVRDAVRMSGSQLGRVFVIRPEHNPVGPLDFAGGFDDLSHRRQSLGELMVRGYEDAYRQFIEPVIGASGEEVAGVSASSVRQREQRG